MKLKVCLIIFLALIGYQTICLADNSELLSLENKYIKLFMNNGPDETGRFAVDVTLGDPGRQDDDLKPLIYGHPRPWTSYTTIQINGKNFVFGKETAKRSGAGLQGGEIIEPPQLAGDQLTMKCKYDSITVGQVLDIVRSPSTGAQDTVRIKYLIQNQGKETAEIGLRALLDTMVGDNDGAPFRLGEQEITYEKNFNKGEYPDFWQAFDSLIKPAVIAQGTLTGADVTPPDRLTFTNWGKAADHPWNFPLQPGTEFTRLGEEELDSAVIMYWDSRRLEPGAKLNIVIYYGLGGITFAPGNTFLGISAPAEMQFKIRNPRNYSIVVYLEHRGEAKAKNVKVKLGLPAFIDLIAGQSEIIIPELIPGATKQFKWEVKPSGGFQGDLNFVVKASGDGLETNQVSRNVKIIGPPLLKATLSAPQLKVDQNAWDPNPLPFTLKVTNSGDSTGHDIKAEFAAESGIQLVPGERSEKLLADLEPGAETTLSWQLEPLTGFRSANFKIQISGSDSETLAIPGVIPIPPLPIKIAFEDPGPLIRGCPGRRA